MSNRIPVVIVLLLLVSMQSHAQINAQLQKYARANKQIDTSLNVQRVVFMGNSITEGWTPHAQTLFKNDHYINRGISGQTTPQMKARFTQDVINLKPKAVVILAGINDIAQNTGYITIAEIANNIEAMTNMALQKDIKVIICSVLPANSFPWRPEIKPANMVIELNQLLKNIAIRKEVRYLDYYSQMVNDHKGLKEAYTYDAVHCTKEGYMVMESLLLTCLKEELGTH
ncbi:MAG: GDSL-type esterase/lipase family protein [Gilvibacter sp.]